MCAGRVTDWTQAAGAGGSLAAPVTRLRRRLALPPDPRITLHLDEVVLPGISGRFWSAMRWDRVDGFR
jgi:hypothetical protein